MAELRNEFETSLSRIDRFKTCVKETAKTRIPLLRWFPKYRRKYILNDAVSGTTVFLTSVPQSMAYAGIAGLTPEYGLYSSFVGPFIYVLFGSCRQMTIGPTAVVELVTYQTCRNEFPTCVILIGFYAGMFQFLMGLLSLGSIVSLISEPVTIGFTAAAALTIVSSQVKNFLGLTGGKGNSFIGTWVKNIENISTTSIGDTTVGVCSVLLLLLLQNAKYMIKPGVTTKCGQYSSRTIWLLSISRNAIIILLGTIIAFCWTDPPFHLTGSVKSGLPPFGLPQFEFPIYENSTLTNSTMSYWATWGKLKTAPLSVAFISILQNVAIAKAFGSGQSIDATQEMFALGITHMVGSFFSGIPISGSFTRSAVNDASGVKSPFGGIFAGILILMSLLFMTPMFKFIPKASLSAVIICAVLSMIEYEALPKMWKVSKLDFLACLITFFSSLIVGLEYGILIGLASSIILYLIKPIRPQIETELVAEEDEESFVVFTPAQGFSFPSVDHIRTFVNKIILVHESCTVLVIDMSKMFTLDYTGANALRCLVAGVEKTGKHLIFVNCVDEEEWRRIFSGVGMTSPPFYKNLEEVHDFVRSLRQVKVKETQGKNDSASTPELERLNLLHQAEISNLNEPQ